MARSPSKNTRPKFVSEGFVVLVQRLGGASPASEAYVVGCSTEAEARSAVGKMYTGRARRDNNRRPDACARRSAPEATIWRNQTVALRLSLPLGGRLHCLPARLG